jgi:hypothetical protein
MTTMVASDQRPNDPSGLARRRGPDGVEMKLGRHVGDGNNCTLSRDCQATPCSGAAPTSSAIRRSSLT